MTLEDMKQKVYALIEEYDENAEELTNDPDFSSKINSVINQIQNELARHKKIPAKKELQVTEGQEMLLSDIDNQIYQLNNIRGVTYDTMQDTVIFNEEGTAKIYYYKYPKQINFDTEDDFKFELDTDLLEIMPYGVAGDMLKSDVSSQYGVVYSNRYRELLSELDNRRGTGVVAIEGGVEL